jgi:translation elongation factor EF-G
MVGTAVLQECCEDGKWTILEPIMTVEVNSPAEFSSAIFGMLNKRSGVILGQDARQAGGSAKF